jgi:hypothetical protein
VILVGSKVERKKYFLEFKPNSNEIKRRKK